MRKGVRGSKEEERGSSTAKTVVKLPKLEISKFKGTHIDWVRFWNQFEAEIDSVTLAEVSKFSYLKELLLPQVSVLVVVCRLLQKGMPGVRPFSRQSMVK